MRDKGKWHGARKRLGRRGFLQFGGIAAASAALWPLRLPAALAAALGNEEQTTHGRAAYILDDVRSLRAVTDEVLAATLHLFEVPPTIQHHVRQTSGYHFPGDAMLRGENRPYGALLTYVANAPGRGSMPVAQQGAEPESRLGSAAGTGTDKDTAFVDIEILDTAGAVIRSFRGPAQKGINRAVWDLRMDGWRSPRLRPREPEDRDRPRGPEVIPGAYTARIKAGGQEARRVFTVSD